MKSPEYDIRLARPIYDIFDIIPFRRRIYSWSDRAPSSIKVDGIKKTWRVASGSRSSSRRTLYCRWRRDGVFSATCYGKLYHADLRYSHAEPGETSRESRFATNRVYSAWRRTARRRSSQLMPMMMFASARDEFALRLMRYIPPKGGGALRRSRSHNHVKSRKVARGRA